MRLAASTTATTTRPGAVVSHQAVAIIAPFGDQQPHSGVGGGAP
jgi:hypothetical protein